MKVEIQRVLALVAELGVINRKDIDEIEFCNHGKPLDISQETLGAWDVTGDTIVDFITSGVWRLEGVENES